MYIFIIGLILCLSGFILLNKKKLYEKDAGVGSTRISVIIPARNEEKNLPIILESLKSQTLMPDEIIVCDDHSEDATHDIAESYGVTLIDCPELPENWTGKNWAVWNGYQKSSGDILIFLDADVILEKRAIEVLVKSRAKAGGAISVIPYHHTEKFYEQLSLLPYLLGVFAFMSPFEKNNKKQGLYGSCIVVKREDYEKIGGHSSVKSELLDDMSLGMKFTSAGIGINNYMGCRFVSFRMYPYGIKGEIEGFGKGAVLSTSNLSKPTVIFIALWIIGLIGSGFCAPVLLAVDYRLAIPFLSVYLCYTLQIFYFLRYTGRYRFLVPILHFISSGFFIYVMFYSIYRVACVGSVSWKGREIKVRKDK